jgi:hypothetical protein
MFMEGLIRKYNKGDTRKINREYDSLKRRRRTALRNHRKKEAKKLLRQMHRTPSRDPMDPDFVRVHWCRYADDGRVFITGSKALAEEIRDRIAAFLKDELKLDLNMDKTGIVNLSQEPCEFLGYEIRRIVAPDKVIHYRNGVDHRTNQDNLSLLMPKKVVT